MENKTRFREILKDNPVTPSFSICAFDIDQNDMFEKYVTNLPVILKSPVSKGSKDVLLVHSCEEFIKANQYFRSRFPKTPILIEEFVEAPQYLIEVVVNHSKITIVAIIEQEISRPTALLLRATNLPARLTEKANEKLNIAIKSIIKGVGLDHGTCHLEMRLVNDDWKLIEINPRISGGADQPINS